MIDYLKVLLPNTPQEFLMWLGVLVIGIALVGSFAHYLKGEYDYRKWAKRDKL